MEQIVYGFMGVIIAVAVALVVWWIVETFGVTHL